MARFASAADRAAYAAAHALLRVELASLLGETPSAIAIQKNALGKPELAGDTRPTPCFSLTHTRRHVACAIGPQPVGIDIEEPDRQIDWSILDLLHPLEREQILESSEAEKRTVFFRIWTLKEAILKSMGTGLITPLDSFAVRLDPLKTEIAPPKTDANNIRLHAGIIGAATPLSVATLTGAGEPPATFVFEPEITEQTPARLKVD